MALHGNMASMAREAIEEYLQTSQICLDFRKSDGGCLGYPSTLLLLCIINAFGTYLAGETVEIEGKSQNITKHEPFRVLNHRLFNLGLTHRQIKLIEKSYRNRLTHNAIIERGSVIVPAGGEPPFIFYKGLIVIQLGSLHRNVSQAWARFPKGRIASWEKRQPEYSKSSAQLPRLSERPELPQEFQQLEQAYMRAKKKRAR